MARKTTKSNRRARAARRSQTTGRATSRTNRTGRGTRTSSRAAGKGLSTRTERARRPDVIREPIRHEQQPEIREPHQQQEAELTIESPEAAAQAEGVARAARRQPRTKRELYERTTDYKQQKRVELDPMASTVQKAHVWLNELMDELGTEDKHRAHQALRAVLHTLRDRLPVDEAVHLGAQLPTLIRGIYYEGWAPAGKPIKYNKLEFFSCIREYFMNLSGIDHGQVVQAVFRLLQKHISEGEIRNIQDSLPEEFAGLWSEEAFAAP
ncbi:MAG TPA: DUF2267 domain-containing protein [Acidobacteriota bacterium]|nr:DUF2267 domain-containing protein [Acidobacteriota bacterium]